MQLHLASIQIQSFYPAGSSINLRLQTRTASHNNGCTYRGEQLVVHLSVSVSVSVGVAYTLEVGVDDLLALVCPSVLVLSIGELKSCPTLSKRQFRW